MAEATEIPEAKDEFEKHVAISIAIMAVVLSFFANRGDNAKTDAIIHNTEAANQWGYYQAKSIKANLYDIQAKVMTCAKGADGKADAPCVGLADEFKKTVERYHSEENDIKKKAEALNAESAKEMEINNKRDFGTLLIQVGIVLASVAILSRLAMFWYFGLLLSIVGVVGGVMSFL